MMSKFHKAIISYIDQTDAIDILNALGARNVQDENRQWIIHSCLIDDYVKHHSNRDDNPSAAIDQKTKRYSCFSYGVISCKHFLDVVFSKDEQKEYEFLRAIPQNQNRDLTAMLQASFKAEEVKRNEKLPLSFLDMYEDNFDYMINKRGISEKALRKHKIKYDSSTNSVVMPLFENEDLLGFQRRNLTPGKPKYQNTEGFDKEEYLYFSSDFGSHSDPVVIVESIMSLLKLESFGYRNIACTMGSVVFDGQINKLSKFTNKVIIWYDDDKSGIKGMRQFLKKAKKLFSVEVVVSDMRHKDPGDMTEEEVNRNMSKKMQMIVAIPFLDKAFDMLCRIDV